MTTAGWFLVIGLVLLLMAAGSARLSRLPLSSAMVYLGVGVALGPSVADVFHVNPLKQSALLEVVTEIAVVISLFAAGLKLGAPFGDRAWWVPFRLASVSMLITVGLVAVVGVTLLDLSLGVAVLLGAILAPTDPVLASDVQVKHPQDEHPIRFALTGEAGLNDGTAFPVVMLGLGLMGLHPMGEYFSRWLLIDVLWACTGGLAIGGALGAACAWIMCRLAARGMRSSYMDDFLGLGLVALAYGGALLIHTYGFLAVFAAGFMLHRTESRLEATRPVEAPLGKESFRQSRQNDPLPSDPFMATVSLSFVEQLERLLEVALIVVLGGMMFTNSWQFNYVMVACVLLLIIRPASVALTMAASGYTFPSKAVIGWFGVKGIGSLYYLFYAIEHGVEEDTAVILTSIALVVVAISIVVHGVTVTPFLGRYNAYQGRSDDD